ncbi:MAG: sugar phosphate isomerase/epimerase family protein [Phycisphaerae bacterium]
MSMKIAFNTANLVGEHTGWRFSLAEWGMQDALTVQRTTDEAFAAMCRRIRESGYEAVELWRAHVEPSKVNESRGRVLRDILQEHCLVPVALAGPLNQETARVCKLLGIGRCCGWMPPGETASVERLMRETGIDFCYENHPETTVEEIRRRVVPGGGLALDLGWLGTQGINAPAATGELANVLRHVHLKDVKAAGGHETVALGTGCVDVEGVIERLKADGYDGWYSWEDEPEDRNPYDIAADMRVWIERHIGA